MFNKNEFRKYAVKHLGMTGMHVDTYAEKNIQTASYNGSSTVNEECHNIFL